MTTYLPEDSEIDVPSLSKVFDDKTNSYKLYWFLAILDSIQKNNDPRIDMRELSMRMIAKVWYPLDYFKLSFGTQDKFKENAKSIYKTLNITSETEALKILDGADNEWVESVSSYIDKTLRYVPYRFVRPFFKVETSGMIDGQVNDRIVELAKLNRQSPYYFDGRYIVIRNTWYSYLQKYQYILRSFTKWHLVQYLQKNNPNVPAISEKLERPVNRNFNAAKPFWKTYLEHHPEMKCIYSGQPITRDNISLDHYLPFSYVAHDQIWNLIPTTKSVNSAKSDLLPDTNLYFDKFAQLQYDAFRFHAESGQAKKLEDYSLLFRESTATIQESSSEWFRERLSQAVLPQLQTAKNMGFSSPFVYRPS